MVQERRFPLSLPMSDHALCAQEIGRNAYSKSGNDNAGNFPCWGGQKGIVLAWAIHSMGREANKNWRNLRSHDVLINVFSLDGAELMLRI